MARTLRRAFSVLEVVADRGGATAREIADEAHLPLSTVYRLLTELVQGEYLIHLRREQRFELGYRLHTLGLALHRQVQAPRAVRQAVESLHAKAAMAAYFATYRGSDVMVNYVSACADHPRLQPLTFGFHEAAHATAFGKIMLSAMRPEERDDYLKARGMPRITDATIVDRAELEAHLAQVSTRGIAWEWAEFVPSKACGAVAVRNPAGVVIGAMAISTDVGRLRESLAATDALLREHASRASLALREVDARFGAAAAPCRYAGRAGAR